MKKFVIGFLSSVLMLSSLSAQAWGGHHGYRNYGGHHGHYQPPRHNYSNNVGKIIIGSAILGATIYALENSRPKVVREEVYIQQQPVYVQSNPIYMERQNGYRENTVVDYLPYGSRVITVDGNTYFENHGVFYQNDGYGRYLVVPRPF